MPDPTATAAPSPTFEVLDLPVAWILAHFRPTEQPTWEETRRFFEENHTHLEVLRDDIARHGVKAPVELHPDGRVLRGHHRLLLADDAGLRHVPAVFGWRHEVTYWDPDSRQDLPYDDDGFDDGWDDEPPPLPEEPLPVPAVARAVARGCGT